MPEEKGTGSSDQNQMAMIAHLLGIVIGFIGPLIIMLTAKDKPFALSQSKEALNFQITITIAWVAAAVLSFIGIGFLLYPLIWVANLIFCIIAGMAANKGEDYKYPFAIRLVK
ncbi:MAG: DUF4870 domain-containing protein [Candidatus Berkelbacteria bacterium]|nr:DUF4870 domain-containing protein [Candidatus Berkelbacteria bacterium]